MEYRVGDPIEVVKKEHDGVSPMYYKATITKRSLLVRYDTRRADPDNPQSDLLQEWVDEADIKPIPPKLSLCEPFRDQVIDVFWGGAWRLGHIVGKHDDYHYNVQLVGNVRLADSLYNELVLTHVSTIRVHLDRSINGTWVTRPYIAD